MSKKMNKEEIEKLKDANPNKLHQQLCGLKKKHKLDLTNPTNEEVRSWIENIK